ncbi:ATP-binding protein [Streptacidiphilus pinicola]|uniref:ATP-binding protein n=1 Tax=Streptacidiphilus pinicola TaxID=2219663 RepID=A0A2X0KBK5_9ACTN|nr:ATP-binding protein [Streptacidiphilus pinicola]RAG86475.1 ATP-binding protein [Streptacidiphilus pinicola]
MSSSAATAPSFGPRHLDFLLHDDVDRVAAGVEFVRAALADWHLGAGPPPGDDERAVDVVLVTAELVGNAERHGGGTRSLDVERRDGRLRLTIHDRSGLPPLPVRPHRAGHASGHGLYIVDRLCTAWGWERDSGGKAVWAELPAPLAP